MSGMHGLITVLNDHQEGWDLLVDGDGRAFLIAPGDRVSFSLNTAKELIEFRFVPRAHGVHVGRSLPEETNDQEETLSQVRDERRAREGTGTGVCFSE